MAQKHRATELLQNNHSIPEIAKELGISVSSVLQYLYLQVGEGKLKRSDILFSIPANERQAIENIIQQRDTDTNFYKLEKSLGLAGHKICPEIIRTYLDLRDVRVSRGDMYELISEIEVTLHDFVRQMRFR
jgi:predicted transcriptional regulator